MPSSISLGGSPFLPSWNRKAFFLKQNTIEASDLSLYTDASGTYGCGAYYQGAWFHYSWQPHQQLPPTTSIQWQELFAIVAATLTWGNHWSRKRICFYYDNQTIVQAWEDKSSKHPKLISLMRLLFLTTTQNNFTVKLKHLPGKSNELADVLSRKQFFLSCTTDKQISHSNPWHSQTALNVQLRDLLQHSLAASTRTTYTTGIQ